PAAAGVPAATVFAYPYGLTDWYAALAVPVLLVPALLMVSTIKYRSFKTFDLGRRRPVNGLILAALGITAIATFPQWSLLVISYTYLVSAFVGLAVTRWRAHRDVVLPASETPAGDEAVRTGSLDE